MSNQIQYRVKTNFNKCVSGWMFYNKYLLMRLQQEITCSFVTLASEILRQNHNTQKERRLKEEVINKERTNLGPKMEILDILNFLEPNRDYLTIPFLCFLNFTSSVKKYNLHKMTDYLQNETTVENKHVFKLIQPILLFQFWEL